MTQGEEASLYSSKRYQNRPIRRSNLRRTVIAFHQYKGSTLASHLGSSVDVVISEQAG